MLKIWIRILQNVFKVNNIDINMTLFDFFLVIVILSLQLELNTLHYVMRCAIWYHLHNLENVKIPMEEC